MRRIRICSVGTLALGLVLASLARDASSDPLPSYAALLPLAGDAGTDASCATAQ